MKLFVWIALGMLGCSILGFAAGFAVHMPRPVPNMTQGECLGRIVQHAPMQDPAGILCPTLSTAEQNMVMMRLGTYLIELNQAATN